MSLVYDGNFIVDGNRNTKLSPNFRLREFERANGTVKVHRELVSALQVLRDRFYASISVQSMSPVGDAEHSVVGLFARIAAADLQRLAQVAGRLRERGHFHRVGQEDDRLYVDIGDPNALPPLDNTEALEVAVQVTAGFETSGDPFQQVTGNFDGAGLSFGPSQVNFGSGTLAPLFRAFEQENAEALRACFHDDGHYDEWHAVLSRSRAARIQWADAHSRGSGKRSFAQPWKRYLEAVGRAPAFRRVMTEYATRKYGRKLAAALSWLYYLVPIEIDHLRCVCSLYDLCTQQGSLNKAHSKIRARIAEDPPEDQFELTRIAVRERGLTANAPWRADCISRRLGILNRERTPATVDDEHASRANRFLYLIRNTRVRDAARLRDKDSM